MTAAEHLPRQPVAIRWLQRVYDRVDNGWVTIFSQDRETGARHTDWATVDTIPALTDTIAHRAATSCVWFGVATRQQRLSNGKRGGVADCETVPALWVDIDIAGPNHANDRLPATTNDALELLHRFPLHPTVIINTGGGIQAWWLLADPIPADDATELLARWGATWAHHADQAGYHLDNVFNVDRVMRLPGTQNRKNTPADVEAIDADWTRYYTADDLDGYTIDLPPAPPEDTTPRLPYIGPKRPGDAFNATRSGNDILAAAGFTHASSDRNGDQHWCRPGKTPREGHGATVYADGHTTIWSDTVTAAHPNIETRRPYDPFGLYTALFHHGDFTAASNELEQQGYGTKATGHDDLSWLIATTPTTPADTDVTPVGQAAEILYQHIDWTKFWDREHTGEDWLVEPLIPRGRQVALWATHKTGKSLLSLEVAAALATGRACLASPATTPINVVYVDLEMTEDDLYERLADMGYGPDDDLTHLRYYLLPALPPLDQAAGGAAVVQLAIAHNADLVVIDTMARAVAGEENDADTYRDFYRNTGIHLKARGIAMIRLDHGGKDASRGQRGSSGKGDDVDVVWHLKQADNGLELRRDVARMSWVPDKVALERIEDPHLRHRVAPHLWPAGTHEAAADLDRLNAPLDISQRAAIELLRNNDCGRKTDIIRAAIKYRNHPDRLLGPGRNDA